MNLWEEVGVGGVERRARVHGGTTDKMDIVLLVGETRSLEDFESVRLFVSGVVRACDISPDRVQIGLTWFSNDLKTMWHLNTHHTKQSLLTATDGLTYTGGRGVRTEEALYYINHENFKPHVGMRRNSQRVAVLITDAESLDNTHIPSQNLKDNGIEIYTIGVKDADVRELRSVASYPKESHTYFVKDFSFLPDIINNLTINLCESTSRLDSVRLVDGTSLCSGRLEVKSSQSNQRWSSVCEDDFDQQDAEVVCKELGCGAPSVLQGVPYGAVEAPLWTKEFQCGGHESALLDCRSSGSTRTSCSPGKAVGLTCSGAPYGAVETPLWTKEFQCGGHESALLDCRSSGSTRTSCSPGKAVGLTCSEPVRLVGGASRCVGELQVKQGEWRPVDGDYWNLKAASSGFTLRECSSSLTSPFTVELTCSDSVRLVDGTSLCSGRLEVKSSQSNQRWSSVCEDDFDQQDAEVVCRELGCGAPSVLQGAPYGAVEAPLWTKEFQCGGHESALLDCRSSGSTRTSCSPGKAVGLTCSEPVRLVGGASRCAGELQVKQESGDQSVWWINSDCVQSGFTLRECSSSLTSPFTVELTCSDSVRLVDGTSLCSGRLEVKSSQSNQRWSSVCEDDFDQQDAEVVCRELGCGAPSVLQGAPYGAVETPLWTKEFQCGGHESALLDCRSSGSTRTSCSPGKAVGLTCSEPVRLVGGASRCVGELQVKQGEWRPVETTGT
ncbi:hypothetical protein INR49_003566 [Caranx melampygus]|nr:hypothetical protein INR49_003566 [Caranx melampygus]